MLFYVDAHWRNEKEEPHDGQRQKPQDGKKQPQDGKQQRPRDGTEEPQDGKAHYERSSSICAAGRITHPEKSEKKAKQNSCVKAVARDKIGLNALHCQTQPF